MATAQKNKSHFKKALGYHRLFTQMKDSISNELTRKASIKNQMQYEYDKKEVEINAMAKAEKEQLELRAADEKKRQNLVIYGIAIILIITLCFSALVYRSLRENQKKNEIIHQQKTIVEIKQKEILDSIHYAKRIQTALLPNEKYIERQLNELNRT